MRLRVIGAVSIVVLAAANAAAQPYVYVLDNGRNVICSAGGCEPPNVVLVNIATGNVLAKLTLQNAFQPVGDMAMSADGRELYVTHTTPAFSSGLAIIDTASHTQTASILLDKRGGGIDVSSNRLYIANPSHDTVSVMDLATRTIVATVAVGDEPGKVAASPDGLDVYVTNQGSNSVSRISTASNTVIGTLPVPSRPRGLRLSPDGLRLFVVSGSFFVRDGTVSVFDAASSTLVATIALKEELALQSNADILAVSATTAYVADNVGGLHLVTTAPNSATKLEFGGYGLAFDAPTSRLFVARGGTMQIWDTTTNKKSTFLQVGQDSRDVVVATGCVFEMPRNVGFTGAGGTGTLTVPAAAGCAWRLTPSSTSFPRFLDPLSGTGPATIRFDVPAATTPSHTTLSYGRGQTIAIDQTMPSMFVDFSRPTATVPFPLGGWAVDVNAASTPGTSVDAIHVWAWPVSGAPPIFAGAGFAGNTRSDIGAIFGSQYANAGFNVQIGVLPPGTYTFVVYARSRTTQQFNNTFSLTITISGSVPAQIVIDTPGANARLRPPLRIAGWAIDPAGPTDTGVDVVHIWAYPASGAPVFMGQAAYGQARLDLNSLFGSRFFFSGFELANGTLPDGAYRIVAFGRSRATGTFSLAASVPITVDSQLADLRMNVENPPANAVLSRLSGFKITGWALDRLATQISQSGIGGIHVWAYPVGGGAPVLAGASRLDQFRPDVSAIFGPQFLTTGFNFTSGVLPAGVYDLVFYAQVASGKFVAGQVVRITVQ